MMFTAYTIEQSEKWDFIVRSFKNYDIYWLSGYVKAFQIHGDGEPLLFYFSDESTRGIHVVMKRDVAQDERFKGKIEEGQYFDFATPYGYGGWIIEGEETERLFASYSIWLKQKGIISEFVRFHPMVRNHAACQDFYEVVELGEVVHIDLTSSEVIWDNFISQNRNKIRKALRNDVKIYNGRFPEIFEKFRIIYNSTMDKDGAEAYYYFGEQFYKSVLEDIPQNAQVFWAEKDGTVIAASIMIGANGHLNYHLSGSFHKYSNLAPTNLLLYEAALWGNANGYKTLYLGGGVGSEKDSLFKFKKAFYKGDLHHFYIGKKIYDKERYKELVSIREEINRDYFPIYRG